MILISELHLLKSNWKYLVLLKSINHQTEKSISIILYGINQNQQNHKQEDLNQEKDLKEENQKEGKEEESEIEWLAIQEECPHLGQSLINAEIQIEDENIIAICPWHNYDFDLRTGESSTGIKACIIKPLIKTLNGIQYLFFNEFELESESKSNQEKEKEKEKVEWTLISIKPISQRFAIPEPNEKEIKESIKDNDELPDSLLSWACLILKTSNPLKKIQFTRYSISLFNLNLIPISNQFNLSQTLSNLTFSNPVLSNPTETINSEIPPNQPSREKSLKTVEFNQLNKNGKSGNLKNRIKLLHSLANIELWAIDLTWDLLCRFGNQKINQNHLPREFFEDFSKVVEDEAKHFTILRESIQRLGSDWGEFPVHDGLWQSARDTSHSLISRICIIHLVHEARGLDVNPTQIKRVKLAGDFETAKVLEIIHADEITHVAAGHKWLNYLCNQTNPKLNPVEVFRREVKLHFMGKLKPPFNVEDRLKAGLDPSFYENLD